MVLPEPVLPPKTKIVITGGVTQINKQDEILAYQDLQLNFEEHENEGFHISEEFYDRIIRHTQNFMIKQEPLKTFKDENIEFTFDPVHVLFTPKIREPNQDNQHKVTFPLTYAKKMMMPDPLVTYGSRIPTVHMSVRMQCNVIQKEDDFQPIDIVPFRTNKRACDNLVKRMKAIAFYAPGIMPHVLLCKLSEVYHSFKLESRDIFMQSWPTSFKTPMHSKADRKYLQLAHTGMYKAHSNNESPTSTSSPSGASSSTRRSPSPPTTRRTPPPTRTPTPTNRRTTPPISRRTPPPTSRRSPPRCPPRCTPTPRQPPPPMIRDPRQYGDRHHPYRK